ncbi:MAG: nuclear transport factor 2 family protein [Myxococcota bacterium]
MTARNVDLDSLARPHWTDQERANAALAADFVRLLMNEHDFDAVRERFGEGSYVQHNHGIADGLEGVLATIQNLIKRFPEYGYDVKTVLVDGDTVVFHSHATLRGAHVGDDRRGFNITDRWRVEEGKLVEHWDSIQPMDRFGRFYALLTGGTVRNANGTY